MKTSKKPLLFWTESSEMENINTFCVFFYLLSTCKIFCQLSLTSYFWRNLIYIITNIQYIYMCVCVCIRFFFLCMCFHVNLMSAYSLFKWTLSSIFSTKIYMQTTYVLHVSPNTFIFVWSPENLWTVKIMKLLIMKTPPVLRYFVLLKLKKV